MLILLCFSTLAQDPYVYLNGAKVVCCVLQEAQMHLPPASFGGPITAAFHHDLARSYVPVCLQLRSYMNDTGTLPQISIPCHTV